MLAMQAAGPPELARIEVEVPQSLSPEQIEEYIDSMTGDTWWDSVMRVLAHGPPTGDVARNRTTAVDLAKEHPLQALFPMVRLGGDGLPRYTPRSDDDQIDDQLTDLETMALGWHGHLLAEGLRRACVKHDPSVEGVVAALAAVGCEGPTAAGIGRVVRRYIDGDHEAAAYTGIRSLSASVASCCSPSMHLSTGCSANTRRARTRVWAPSCRSFSSEGSTSRGTANSARCFRRRTGGTSEMKRSTVSSTTWDRPALA